MAVRSVSIKVMLDGYQEYRNTMAKLNAQNRLLEATLKDIDAQYGKNSKSVDAVREKLSTLQLMEKNQRERLQATNQMLGEAIQKQKDYAAQMVVAQIKVNETTEALKNYRESGENNEDIIKRLEQAQKEANDELSTATKNYTTATNEVARLTKERATEEKTLKDVKTQQALLKGEVKETTDVEEKNITTTQKVVDVWQRFKDIIGVAKDVFVKVKDATMASINSFVDYEAAFTSVEKTVDGTDKQLEMLNKDIKEMSSTMPYAAKDIANIASLAGQLGVGIDDISGFTEVMLGLGTATNLTAEDASTMLAQFQNITGFEADKIKNIASVIVDLGNNSATTERDIMEMAQRFASAGTLAGLSAPDILGMSAALSSVGIGAEAGGTSLSKMTQKIQGAIEKGGKGLEDFARVAGVSAEDFAKAWKESPVEAINMFLSGIGKTYEEGDSVLELLDELGFGEVRLRNATQALALSEKDLGYYVGMANDAFKDTSAYDTEVGRFLDTTQSSVQILKNNFELLKIQVGESLSPAFDDLVKSGGNLIGAITTFLEQHPFIIEALSAIIGFFGDVADGIAGILTKNKEYIGDVERFGQVAVNTRDVINDSTKAYADQEKAIQDTVTQADDYIRVLQECEKDGKITREEQEKYNEAIDKLKGLFPDLNIEIDKHTGMIKGGTDAVKEQIEAWKENAIAEARAYRLTQLYKNLYDAQDELSKNTKQLRLDRKALDRTSKELNDAEAEYAELMGRNIPLTDEQRKRRKELEEQIKTLKKEQDELNQKIADEEVAIIADKDAMVESQDAIKNWEDSEKRATEATDKNTEAVENNAEAHEKAADSYDQSAKAEEGGKKTTQGYAKGVQGYSTSSEWNNIMNGVRNGVYASFGDAATAYKKGQEITKQLGLGIASSASSIKEAGKKINEALANTIRKNYKWQMQMKNGTANYVAMFAEGGVVNRATPAIVGEAGTEAIIPLKKLPDIMTKYMQNQQSMSNFYGSRSNQEQRDVDTIVSLLNRYLPKMSNQQVVLDSNKLVGTLAPKIDTYFTNQMIAEGRGQ